MYDLLLSAIVNNKQELYLDLMSKAPRILLKEFDHAGATVAHYLVLANEPAGIRYISQYYPELFEVENDAGETPYILAKKLNYIEITQFLEEQKLDHGVIISMPDTPMTPVIASMLATNVDYDNKMLTAMYAGDFEAAQEYYLGSPAFNRHKEEMLKAIFVNKHLHLIDIIANQIKVRDLIKYLHATVIYHLKTNMIVSLAHYIELEYQQPGKALFETIEKLHDSEKNDTIKQILLLASQSANVKMIRGLMPIAEFASTVEQAEFLDSMIYVCELTHKNRLGPSISDLTKPAFKSSLLFELGSILSGKPKLAEELIKKRLDASDKDSVVLIIESMDQETRKKIINRVQIWANIKRQTEISLALDAYGGQHPTKDKLVTAYWRKNEIALQQFLAELRKFGKAHMENQGDYSKLKEKIEGIRHIINNPNSSLSMDRVLQDVLYVVYQALKGNASDLYLKGAQSLLLNLSAEVKQRVNIDHLYLIRLSLYLGDFDNAARQLDLLSAHVADFAAYEKLKETIGNLDSLINVIRKSNFSRQAKSITEMLEELIKALKQGAISKNYSQSTFLNTKVYATFMIAFGDKFKEDIQKIHAEIKSYVLSAQLKPFFRAHINLSKVNLAIYRCLNLKMSAEIHELARKNIFSNSELITFPITQLPSLGRNDLTTANLKKLLKTIEPLKITDFYFPEDANDQDPFIKYLVYDVVGACNSQLHWFRTMQKNFEFNGVSSLEELQGIDVDLMQYEAVDRARLFFYLKAIVFENIFKFKEKMSGKLEATVENDELKNLSKEIELAKAISSLHLKTPLEREESQIRNKNKRKKRKPLKPILREPFAEKAIVEKSDDLKLNSEERQDSKIVIDPSSVNVTYSGVTEKDGWKYISRLSHSSIFESGESLYREINLSYHQLEKEDYFPNKISLPKAFVDFVRGFERFLNRQKSHSYEGEVSICLTGGALRDALLGRMDFASDFDVTVLGMTVECLHVSIKKWAEDQRRLFTREMENFECKLMGYGNKSSLQLKYKGFDIDISSCCDHPPSSKIKSINALSYDGWRRDFTFNALYLMLSSKSKGMIIDFHQGLRHLLLERRVSTLRLHERLDFKNPENSKYIERFVFDKHPERLLRAIALVLIFDMKLSKTLRDNLSNNKEFITNKFYMIDSRHFDKFHHKLNKRFGEKAALDILRNQEFFDKTFIGGIQQVILQRLNIPAVVSSSQSKDSSVSPAKNIL